MLWYNDKRKKSGDIVRRKIKSELKNLTTNEITNHNSNCIVNQNKIKYQDNDTSYEIRIKNNEIIVIRDNSKFTHAMQFQKGKTHKSNYLLKEPDLNLELNIKTKELDIKEDKIYIKYEILESNNIFEYKIELEDILWV